MRVTAPEKARRMAEVGGKVAEWVDVASIDDLQEQLRVEVGGIAYAIFRLDGGIYALDDVCSHEYSRLSEGELWDDEVYCPKHGSRFDIKTGAVRSLPAFRPVESHRIKIENDRIFIDVSGG